MNKKKFYKAVQLFNELKWYESHDAFESLWHEAEPSERLLLQGILQIAVAQVHLERGNTNGATILYGEGLGRLRKADESCFGLDIKRFSECVELRLKLLQEGRDPDAFTVPILFEISKDTS